MAAARPNSWFLPPRPLPRIVTVVSPPEIMHAGGGIGRPVLTISLAMALCTNATSLVSPSTAEERIRVSYPSACAFSLAASRANILLPTIILKTGSNTGSFALGVSGIWPSSPAIICSRIVLEISSKSYLLKISKTSLKVELSGVKGPDAITSILSPTTSESIKLTVVAGYAALAICPPLEDEICFLTVFISSILAPQASKLLVSSCFSERLIFPAGWGSKAEPPPDIREKIRSFSPALCSKSRIFLVPFTPFWSGKG
ncbi:hypothetical protein ES703_125528 [subsurface metagenome]